MPFLTHYVAGSLTKFDIHQEIRGRVPELVTALAIDPESLHKHIHCPFESHQDRHPSFRIDAAKARFFCSCTPRGGSMIDLVMRLHTLQNASGAIGWIRAQLNGQTGPSVHDKPNKKSVFPMAARISGMPVTQANRYPKRVSFEAVVARCKPANCSPNSLHPYAKKKGILPIEAMLDPVTNKLVLQVHDVNGTLQGLQFIDVNGEKRFAAGTKLLGNGCILGEPCPEEPVAFCEGWATGVAIHCVLDIAVVVTFSANNLVAAAQRFSVLTQQRYIFGENDDHGVGQRAAKDAAATVRGRLWLPPDKFIGDFNDFHTPLFKGRITHHSSTRFGVAMCHSKNDQERAL
jgi:phage/plasmid primase-like uncharacterized protein